MSVTMAAPMDNFDGLQYLSQNHILGQMLQSLYLLSLACL